jgi:hypothetical protein
VILLAASAMFARELDPQQRRYAGEDAEDADRPE